MKVDVKGVLGTVTTVGSVLALVLSKTGQQPAADAVLSCTGSISLETPALCKEAAVETAKAAKSLYDYALILLVTFGSGLNLFANKPVATKK